MSPETRLFCMKRCHVLKNNYSDQLSLYNDKIFRSNINVRARVCDLFIIYTYIYIFFLSIRKRNNKWALQRAKANVVRWYPVVGLLDYMEETLNVLQKEFPYFFTGSLRIYNKLRKYFVSFFLLFVLFLSSFLLYNV